MRRAIAGAVAGAAAIVSLHVPSAQQAPQLRLQASSPEQLRAADQFITALERTGDLRVAQVARDPALPGRTVERLRQYHRGVRVWGAEVVRDTDRGVPLSIFAELSAPSDLDVRPRLTLEAAATRLLAGGPAGALLSRAAELVVVRLERGEERLAYTGVVAGAASADRVFIDAATGAEVLRYSMVHTQAEVGTGRGLIGDLKKVSAVLRGGLFMADDPLRPPSLTTYDLRGNLPRALQVSFNNAPLFVSDIASDPDNDWNDATAVDAHAYVGYTYDYYFKRHGRRGLDDRDRPLVAIINPVTPQAALTLPPEAFFSFAVNAFWCDACGPGAVGVMFFGSGIPATYTLGGLNVFPLAGSIDVVGHELTHGVIDSSSALIYQNESGALNEAFADIMGTAVEFYYQQPGSGLGQADYLIGEDSFRRPNVGPVGIRSMANPAAFGDPDHYSRRFTGPEDNGGVHINSGIANHAFYLAVQGGVNATSGLPVQGVGAANREQIERAFYRAFVFLLPASATFSTARAATIQAAQDLYGPASAAAQAIAQAWTAVGVQ